VSETLLYPVMSLIHLQDTYWIRTLTRLSCTIWFACPDSRLWQRNNEKCLTHQHFFLLLWLLNDRSELWLGYYVQEVDDVPCKRSRKASWRNGQEVSCKPHRSSSLTLFMYVFQCPLQRSLILLQVLKYLWAWASPDLAQVEAVAHYSLYLSIVYGDQQIAAWAGLSHAVCHNTQVKIKMVPAEITSEQALVVPTNCKVKLAT